MSLTEDYNQRVASNFEGLVIALLAGVFAVVGEAMSEATTSTGNAATDSTVDALIITIQSYPTLLTLIGFVVVLAAAGPFGFVGFLFEILGVNIFLSNPETGLVSILIGAGIIVIGRRAWKWRYFFEWLNSGSGQHGRMR